MADGLIRTRKEFGETLVLAIQERYSSIAEAAKHIGIEYRTLEAFVDGCAFPSLPAGLNHLCERLDDNN